MRAVIEVVSGLKRFRMVPRNVLVGAILLLLTITVICLINRYYRGDPVTVNMPLRLKPPGPGGWLGYDQYGRDVLARMAMAGPRTLWLALSATAVGAALGLFMGIVGGYFGGLADSLGMRLMDVLLTVPPLVLALIITAVIGSGDRNIVIAVGVTNIPVFARLVRSSVLVARENLYVEAALASGASDARVIWRHIMPSCVGPTVVMVTLRLGSAILTESSLSFLGLGVDPLAPTWGGMLAEARSAFELAPWLGIFPGIAITVVVVAFNLLGDGLQDYLNPKLRGSRASLPG